MVHVYREGVVYALDHASFGLLAIGRDLRPSDRIWDGQSWCAATACSDSGLTSAGEHSNLAGTALKLAVLSAGAFLAIKGVQALLDEDFGGRSFPVAFREEKIDAHLDAHGSVCLHCDRRVPIRELTLDHIFPWSRGGLTSRFNAEVMCRSCNSSKGANAGLLEWLRGRAA